MGHPSVWSALLLVAIIGLFAVILTKLGPEEPPLDAQREWRDLPEWQRKSRGQ